MIHNARDQTQPTHRREKGPKENEPDISPLSNEYSKESSSGSVFPSVLISSRVSAAISTTAVGFLYGCGSDDGGLGPTSSHSTHVGEGVDGDKAMLTVRVSAARVSAVNNESVFFSSSHSTQVGATVGLPGCLPPFSVSFSTPSVLLASESKDAIIMDSIGEVSG